MPDYYVERLRRMLRLVGEHNLVNDGDRVLELGTGWLHWEALTLRLFWDIEAVLYDVWDNRQLGALKNYCRQLRPMLTRDAAVTERQLRRAQSLIDAIVDVESFQELYHLLGFDYIVDSSGSLSRFESNEFDLVVSAGVLEHVHRVALSTLVAETLRVLKPRGWAIHSIDTADHLSHYDPTVSKKFYLGISESTWARYFENDVQYINRLQRGDWIALFDAAGFQVVEEDSRRIDIGGLTVAPHFLHMDRKDLECTVVRLAMRPPPCILEG